MIVDINKIYPGSCLDTMKSWPDNSIDSIVTDPPYELGFMGKSWDSTGIAYSAEMWREALRVLKPGGHLLAFGGTRTYHRMACAIEDAGFEIRDQMQWLYGSGFPKSLNISKALDKAAGAEREVIGKYQPPGMDKEWNLAKAKDERTVGVFSSSRNNLDITAPATDSAKVWDGWGTALKPANEPICMARKPLSEATVAANVLRWGTGALNIDASRVACAKGDKPDFHEGDYSTDTVVGAIRTENRTADSNPTGRWPANIILDEEAGKVLDCQAPHAGAFAPVRSGHDGKSNGIYGDFARKGDDGMSFYADKGGASRFFYCAKVSQKERNRGVDKNTHPTVKPIALMSYLIKLVTPKGGIVLDPFMGSGSTGCAAVSLGFPYLGCEMSAEYIQIAEARIAAALTSAPDSAKEGL